MMGILRGKLSANTARDAMFTGKRYTADEAIAAGIADGKASERTAQSGKGAGGTACDQGAGHL